MKELFESSYLSAISNINQELRDRINKAIEYIESNINELKEKHLFIEFRKEELYTLLDILKGEDIKWFYYL